jgi:hypothetical protein
LIPGANGFIKPAGFEDRVNVEKQGKQSKRKDESGQVDTVSANIKTEPLEPSRKMSAAEKMRQTIKSSRTGSSATTPASTSAVPQIAKTSTDSSGTSSKKAKVKAEPDSQAAPSGETANATGKRKHRPSVSQPPQAKAKKVEPTSAAGQSSAPAAQSTEAMDETVDEKAAREKAMKRKAKKMRKKERRSGAAENGTEQTES